MADAVAPSVPVFDISGEKPVAGTMHPSEVTDAISSGQYSFPKGQEVHVVNPDGQVGTMAPEEAPEAFKNGYSYATPEVLTKAKYGTTEQQVKAGLEGVASGIAGPLAPYVEKQMGVNPEAIRGRAEANPVTSTVGQLAGLATGVGEAKVLGMAGEFAAEATGLADATKYLGKIGSSAVKSAAEMAVLQGGDEVSKMILNDPSASADSALANIGLASAIGGVTGGAFGVVSPLWKATVGEKLENTLGKVKSYLDGDNQLGITEKTQNAAQSLGLSLDPLQQAAVSDNPEVRDMVATLRRAENHETLNAIHNLHKNVSDSVMNSLGLTKESVEQYDKSVGGQEIKDTLKDEIKKLYDPVKEAMDQRAERAAPIQLSEADKTIAASRLIEQGAKDFGVDSDYYRLYDKYASRLQYQETVGNLDRLKTELNGDIRKAFRAGDSNTGYALNTIKSTFEKLQESTINTVEESAIRDTGANNAEELIAQRKAQNKQYRVYADKMNDLLDHLGLGEFRGTAGALSKIIENTSPEDLYRKASIKDNVSILPMLKENFPNTLSKIIENDRKELVKPAILSAKGDQPIDINKLDKIISNNMAGRKEYLQTILPEEAIGKTQQAKVLLDNVIKPRDSGTPAGISKILKNMIPSAIAGISWATGHGPVGGYMLGKAAEYLGKGAPESTRLAYLKFLASDKPVNAAGFKAAVDFANQVAKGQSTVNKAAKALFAAGPVLVSSQLSTPKERTKLDNMVKTFSERPEMLLHVANSDVGHYLPDQHTAMTMAMSRTTQYLSTLQPKPVQMGILDKPAPPDPIKEARYKRALDIANRPISIFDHIKDGTIHATDLQDLQAMYPALYNNMKQSITTSMVDAQHKEVAIPYKTRMSISLFLGQPVDNTMVPTSISSAQSQFQPVSSPPQESPKNKGSTKNLGKSTNKTYMTPEQSAENRRSTKD